MLKTEGVIFISIEKMKYNLKIFVQIFGYNYKCGIVSRLMKSGGNKGNYFSPNIDYILVYAKDKRFMLTLKV
ncbi:MAG: hypothetical protein IPP79_09095 [Chitinophagaceae bacterium]|nr:hypothetical protein [Chitinophagaceae bacterium]